MKKIKRILTLCISVLLILCFSVSSVGALTFYIPGDVDGNGRILIHDVTLIQKHLAAMATISEKKILSADFDGDGNVNIIDATQIQKKLVGMEYNAVAKKDNSYLRAQNNTWTIPYKDLPEGVKIEGEQVLCGRDVFFSCNSLPSYTRYGWSQAALITSVDQYYSLMTVCSPEFDAEFFEEYALIVIFSYEGEHFREPSVVFVEVKGEKLVVDVAVYDLDGPDIECPTTPLWHLFYKIKQSDIDGVTELYYY